MSDKPFPPVKLAFIIDGKVLDMLHTDDRLAAIFLSEPTIIDVTDKYEDLVKDNPHFSFINWDFDGEKFTPPTE